MRKVEISYSSITTYLDCGEKYRLDKIEKIRPEKFPSPFLFGSAIDSAIEFILLEKGDPKKEFERVFRSSKWNGEVIDPFKSDKVHYYKSDLDESLIEGITEYKEAHSLLKKGFMLIDKFIKWYNEHIEEVLEVQKYLSTTSPEGDLLRGYLDFKAKFKDGVTRIVDLKTASNPKAQYPDGCADNSPQLAIYAELEEVYDVAYYILDKKIRKTEPRVRDRYVKGHISPEYGDFVFDKLEKTVVEIKEENFIKNWSACNKYGGCPYKNYCKTNGQDMTGLINIKEKRNE